MFSSWYRQKFEDTKRVFQSINFECTWWRVFQSIDFECTWWRVFQSIDFECTWWRVFQSIDFECTRMKGIPVYWLWVYLMKGIPVYWLWVYPDEGYSRDTWCALNYISTVLLNYHRKAITNRAVEVCRVTGHYRPLITNWFSLETSTNCILRTWCGSSTIHEKLISPMVLWTNSVFGSCFWHNLHRVHIVSKRLEKQ
jgi:hypothetical protein